MRRAFAWVIVAGLVVLLAVVIVYERALEADWVRAEYPDLATARAAGDVDRGWIPAWVPEGARDIREVHNLDSNLRWMVFQLEPEAVEALLANLELEGFHAVQVASPRLPRVFESKLHVVLPPVQTQSLHLLRNAPANGRYGEFVAVQPDLGRVYLWSASR